MVYIICKPAHSDVMLETERFRHNSEDVISKMKNVNVDYNTRENKKSQPTLPSSELKQQKLIESPTVEKDVPFPVVDQTLEDMRKNVSNITDNNYFQYDIKNLIKNFPFNFLFPNEFSASFNPFLRFEQTSMSMFNSKEKQLVSSSTLASHEGTKRSFPFVSSENDDRQFSESSTVKQSSSSGSSIENAPILNQAKKCKYGDSVDKSTESDVFRRNLINCK